MDTMGNAFSMSPVSATLLVLNLKMMSSMFCVSVGPVCRQSFSDGPLDLADAS